MRVPLLTLFFVLVGRLAAPSAATAQYHRLTDAIVVGGTLASAGSGSETLAGGPEIGGLIEIPIGDELRVRGEAAAGFWHFNGYPYDQIAGSAMRRHRLTLSVLRSRDVLSPSRRLAGYGGGGAGLYFYRYASRPDSGGWGIHGIVGAEYLLPTIRSRWIAAGELQLHAMGGPRGPTGLAGLPMLSAHVAALVKYRLP
jgi:hypothetical protein